MTSATISYLADLYFGDLTPAGTDEYDPGPGAAERKARRPNSAPAYYLGHPAALWLTVMAPRRGARAR
jgi:hypothetical protein